MAIYEVYVGQINQESMSICHCSINVFYYELTKKAKNTNYQYGRDAT